MEKIVIACLLVLLSIPTHCPTKEKIFLPVITLPVVTVKADKTNKNKAIEMLARIVSAEAGGECVKGQYLVAQVVINRAVKWGMTVPAVIKQKGQFDGYNNEDYKADIDLQILKMCKLIYDKPNFNHTYLFFLNLEKSTDLSLINYAKSNQGKKIGNHYFF